MWVKIWGIGVDWQDILRDDPRRKGLRSRLGAACVIDEPFTTSELLEDLHCVKRGLVIRESRLAQCQDNSPEGRRPWSVRH